MLVRLIAVLVALLALVALYFAAALSWSYSSGERAGWVQKLSKRGWVCKTWEGELALVSMPGATPEKFAFTIFDDGVAQQITQVMGKRVNLHYEEKVGLPTSCFGETRHYVKAVTVSEEIPLAPGITVTAPGASAPAAAAASALPVPVPAAPAAPASAASQ
jgi:hypothetical protein